MATPANAQNTGRKNPAPALDADPDFEGWEKEQTGFAPFWVPAEGESFYATCFGRDDRDPDFIRYMMVNQSVKPLGCSTGPKGSRIDQSVAKGESFNIGAYSQLQNQLDFYLRCGIPVPMKVTAVRKGTCSSGDLWHFDLIVSPEVKKVLMEKRRELQMDSDERKAIAEGT